MADPFGFLKYERKDNPFRPVAERILDFEELQVPLSEEDRQKQAARCMACGIPFCHSGQFYGGGRAVSGCPNDNLIPEWNDLVYKGDYKRAFERLSRTNPLPEMFVQRRVKKVVQKVSMALVSLSMIMNALSSIQPLKMVG